MKSKVVVDALKGVRNKIILELYQEQGFTVSEIAIIINQSKQLVSHIIRSKKIKKS